MKATKNYSYKVEFWNNQNLNDEVIILIIIHIKIIMIITWLSKWSY